MRPVILAKSVSSLPRPTLRPGFTRVPRCRTIMVPPGTTCPPNALNPSRCEFESRPFRELPNPFLCAINQFSVVSSQFVVVGPWLLVLGRRSLVVGRRPRPPGQADQAAEQPFTFSSSLAPSWRRTSSEPFSSLSPLARLLWPLLLERHSLPSVLSSEVPAP